ncbi:MAG: hypothetical protein CMJ40_09265 [Phycisphaerae bacterium]|nr:hypothetical protein [Phycisphaerae bacterium]|tara:strand:+ start:3004 stop:3960 length:957 start_codon:yes stop_codon:yes gene_type:complete
MIVIILCILGTFESILQKSTDLSLDGSQGDMALTQGTDIDSIIRIQQACGLPTLIVTPSRPGNPLQRRLVSSLDSFLAPFSIEVVDQESSRADQERAADLVYSETSDPARATSILLARRGDYDLHWILEVAIDGPEMVYGIETWEATAQLHATVSDLLIGRDIETIEFSARSRKENRESAIDTSIDSVLNQLGIRTERIVLDDWYGFIDGNATILVQCDNPELDPVRLERELSDLNGVTSAIRLMPDTPVRFQVTGALMAKDVVDGLQQGRVESCRFVVIGSYPGIWNRITIIFLISFAIVIYLLRPRRKTPKKSDPQ